MFHHLILLVFAATVAQAAEYDCNVMGGSCLSRSSCPQSTNGRPNSREGICPHAQLGVICCMTYPRPGFSTTPKPTPSNVWKCGISMGGTFRIISGIPSQPGQWPWQVGLWLNGKHVCGGSLIDAETVVTAAHCAILSRNVHEWKVLYGATSRVNHGGRVATLRTDGAGIRMHHLYNNDVTQGNDIAILKLANPVKLDPFTSTVCLPTSNQDNLPVGTRCYTSGWGTTGHHFNMEENLRHVDVQIIDKNRCAREVKLMSNGMYNLNIQSSLCTYGADNVSNKSACKGDSGGPLVCQRYGSWFLHGIVSWGDFPCGMPNKPAIFTKVTSFLDWIQQNRY